MQAREGNSALCEGKEDTLLQRQDPTRSCSLPLPEAPLPPSQADGRGWLWRGRKRGDSHRCHPEDGHLSLPRPCISLYKCAEVATLLSPSLCASFVNQWSLWGTGWKQDSSGWIRGLHLSWPAFPRTICLILKKRTCKIVHMSYTTEVQSFHWHWRELVTLFGCRGL